MQTMLARSGPRARAVLVVCALLLLAPSYRFSIFFFFNDTATTEIYTLSLHDALPISRGSGCPTSRRSRHTPGRRHRRDWSRSEEHTSELQSRLHLVCRLLLEKKKKKNTYAEDTPGAEKHRCSAGS